MGIFESSHFDHHEQVVFCNDDATGLRAIIAIHNTNRGPSLGGCRMWPYGSEDEAIADVLRLSRGMTYKSAVANLPLGGGKSVVIGDPRKDKSPALFESLGRFIDSLGGRYIVAEDVGTDVADLDAIRSNTRFAAGTSSGVGNPSPSTALGVFVGIEAAIRFGLHKGTCAGLRMAVQGLGHVGYDVARRLAEAGAKLYVTDVDQSAVSRAADELGATPVSPNEIYDADADIFVPCALGAILNDDTVDRLKARIVAGAANNQLAAPRHGQALFDRGIFYAPDYVINAGGVIHIASEGPGISRKDVSRLINGIGDTLTEIFARSEAEGLPTNLVADRLAEERFARI